MVLKGPRSTLLGTPSLVRGEIKIWLYLPSFPSPPLLHPSLFLTHRYTVIRIYIYLSSIPIHHLQLSPSASSFVSYPLPLLLWLPSSPSFSPVDSLRDRCEIYISSGIVGGDSTARTGQDPIRYRVVRISRTFLRKLGCSSVPRDCVCYPTTPFCIPLPSSLSP